MIRSLCRSILRRRSVLQLRRHVSSSSSSSKSKRLNRTCSSYKLAVTDSKYLDTSFSPRLFNSLRLSSFDDKNLRDAFESVDADKSGTISRDEMSEFLSSNMIISSNTSFSIDDVTDTIFSRRKSDCVEEMKFEDFKSIITEMAEERDPRVYPIAGTMLIAGTAVGVILPVMPILVHSIGLSQGQFGIIVASFGLSKLIVNIPAATMTDIHGRRNVMVGGLAFISTGMLGFAFANSFEHMVMSRLLTGAGVSALITGATMSVVDISTPLNRARMVAPMSAAFSVGTVCGPAIGGYLAEHVGISQTFMCVSGIFLVNLMYTRYFIQETMKQSKEEEEELASSSEKGGQFSRAIAQWRPIFRDTKLRNLMGLNTCYWISLSGANMTLLPLMLSDADKFDLDPSWIGAAFALQSVTSVVCTVPASYIADKFGASRMIAPALLVTGFGMTALPLCNTIPEAFSSLMVWAVGSAMLGS